MNAFSGCTALSSIYVNNPVPPTGADFENQAYMNAALHVPQGSLADYQAAIGWKDFWSIREFVPNGIEGAVAEEGLRPVIKAAGGLVTVTDAAGTVAVYDMGGALLKEVKAVGGSAVIPLPVGKVYVVKVGDVAEKVAMQRPASGINRKAAPLPWGGFSVSFACGQPACAGLFPLYCVVNHLAQQGVVGACGCVGSAGRREPAAHVEQQAVVVGAHAHWRRAVMARRRGYELCLEVAAVGRHGGPAGCLAERHLCQVAGVFAWQVGIGGVRIAVDVTQLGGREQVGDGAVGDGVEQFCWRLAYAAHVAFGHEPRRLGESVAAYEVERGLLFGLCLRRVYRAGFLGALVCGINAADVAQHVSLVSHELVYHLAVHFLYVAAEVGFLARPVGQCLYYALEVHYAILAGADGVVAQVLGLGARVVVVPLASEPVARAFLKLLHYHLVEHKPVFFLVGSAEQRLVAPLDGPLVVVVDAGEEAVAAHVVLGLRHVVEAGVVHD